MYLISGSINQEEQDTLGCCPTVVTQYTRKDYFSVQVFFTFAILFKFFLSTYFIINVLLHYIEL
jgi:hypothetical protein